jgi:hypothetical protein
MVNDKYFTSSSSQRHSLRNGAKGGRGGGPTLCDILLVLHAILVRGARGDRVLEPYLTELAPVVLLGHPKLRTAKNTKYKTLSNTGTSLTARDTPENMNQQGRRRGSLSAPPPPLIILPNSSLMRVYDFLAAHRCISVRSSGLRDRKRKRGLGGRCSQSAALTGWQW